MRIPDIQSIASLLLSASVAVAAVLPMQAFGAVGNTTLIVGTTVPNAVAATILAPQTQAADDYVLGVCQTVVVNYFRIVNTDLSITYAFPGEASSH